MKSSIRARRFPRSRQILMPCQARGKSNWLEKIASLQHLVKHYKSKIEKLGKHLDRSLALAVRLNDSAEKKKCIDWLV